MRISQLATGSILTASSVTGKCGRKMSRPNQAVQDRSQKTFLIVESEFFFSAPPKASSYDVHSPAQKSGRRSFGTYGNVRKPLTGFSV